MTWLELFKRWLYIRRVNRIVRECCTDCDVPLLWEEIAGCIESAESPRCEDCAELYELDMRERAKKFITVEGSFANLFAPGLGTGYHQSAALHGMLQNVAGDIQQQQQALEWYLSGPSTSTEQRDNLFRAFGADPIQH